MHDIIIVYSDILTLVLQFKTSLVIDDQMQLESIESSHGTLAFSSPALH